MAGSWYRRFPCPWGLLSWPWQFLLGNCGSGSVLCRGDPDTAAGGGHQVQDFHPDSSAGGTGRGVPGLLQRTLCPAHPADTKHSHCLVHLRVNCVSLGRPHKVAEPRLLLQTEDQFLHWTNSPLRDWCGWQCWWKNYKSVTTCGYFLLDSCFLKGFK